MTRSILVVLLAAIAGGTGNAQSSASPGIISHPTSAAFLGGISAEAGDAGGSAGGVFAFDVRERVAVEGWGL
jgi:hypothetical protein